MKSGKRFTLHALALAGLILVFGMYAQPEFMMAMANMVWSCF
jgi:hypothetical protein